MTAHPLDSRQYGHLWSDPDVRILFTDKGRLQSWLDILAALAEAQADVGLVPKSAAQSIRAHAQIDRLDLDLIAKMTKETGHSTLGLIRCLQEVLPPSASEWIYYGATVQDITDTWTSLIFKRITQHLDQDLERAELASRRLAYLHRNTVMSGRTHGQVGLPTTFGFKSAVWAAEIARHRTRLREGSARWNVVELGGGLGTMEFWGDQALPLIDGFAARIDLLVPEIPWLTARDRVAEFVGVVAMAMATLGKIGQEIYQLQRPEIGEVSERPTTGVVGSITMPHKVNPEASEHLVTLARLVRPNAGLALEAMIQEHERDGRAWKAEWVFIPETCMYASAASRMAADLLEGLRVHGDRMMSNLHERGGYPMSEPVMRELSKTLGKHAAHQLVFDVAVAGKERHVSFAQALLDDPRVREHLDESTILEVLSPERAIGSAAQLVERVLRSGNSE